MHFKRTVHTIIAVMKQEMAYSNLIPMFALLLAAKRIFPKIPSTDTILFFYFFENGTSMPDYNLTATLRINRERKMQ